MKQLLKKSAAVVLMAWSAVSFASWESASTAVDQSIKEMLDVVNGYKAQATPDENGLINDLDQIVDRDVDFRYISAWVMGKYYRQASDEQKERFAQVFKHTLIKTYAKSMLEFDIKTYNMVAPTSESPEADKQIVTVNVAAENGQTYTLVNYLVSKEDQWKLVNVIMNGINFRITFKNQFADLMQRNGYDLDKVIGAWETQIKPPSTQGEASANG
jgi:phospholipid transport system substrate-binding protein